MLVPIYGFLAGDTLGLLVLVHDHETVRELAERLQQAAAPRVAARPQVHVYFEGRQLALDLTVGRAGLTALDRIEVRPVESADGR